MNVIEKPFHYNEQLFYIIYKFNGITILYYSINNVNNFYQFRYLLNLYIKNNPETTDIVYIIYFDENDENKNNFTKLENTQNVILLQIDANYKMFFHLHLLRHDYFYKNQIINNKLDISNICSTINVSLDNFKEKTMMYNRKEWLLQTTNNNLFKYSNTLEIIHYIDSTNEIYQSVVEYIPITNIEYYTILLEKLNNYLINNIPNFFELMDFKKFCEVYSFETTGQIYSSSMSKNIVLENVYYMNRCWYNNDRTPLYYDDFYNDFEYKEFRNSYKHKDISNMTIQENMKICDEVMYLDYIYDFYNFGEFWDCIKRLMISTTKNLPLFHLSNNRITDINFYFNKLEYVYPTSYTTSTNEKNTLFYFKKINISTISNCCRGYIDNFFAYNFNKFLNFSQISEKSYNIYLARGKYGRSIQNETEIIDILKNKYNFIVLDGSESLEDICMYFTNANIILGAHGSLMKNMIWARKNPVFIELCPYTRHLCFYDNSINCGFTTFFFILDCDEKEQIIFNEIQREGLYSLLNLLCQK